MVNTKIRKILSNEIDRQREEHNFIASENFVSQEVMYFCGSGFTNKYAEGYPDKRYYNGCKYYDELETYGIDLVTKFIVVNLLISNHIVVLMQI